MLELKNIVKTYDEGSSAVEALKGISVGFRESEFVAVLGPSGCGKTTMLNIIGGLDKYTDGDLFIDGVSTKEYTDLDWDSYRNHSVGFVFQSYNLIPHQSVLSNVELALTLSGVPKAERRERARRMLEKVGLGDQVGKKPNQLSGGQMQRVAIARALVNDPKIILADEPTGALDTETGVQLMEILKEIARDRLVIMVTHNPELAEKYATRTVRLLDGRITDDTVPFDASAALKAEAKAEAKADRKARREKKKRAKAHSMSFATALSLSLKNLFTKRGRTVLTSFAGSIGIIGISLILAMSHGATNYIHRVEKDTLSGYPITIEKQSVDVASLLESLRGARGVPEERPLDRVYSSNMMSDMLKTMLSEVQTNDLKSFKTFIDGGESGLDALTTDIQYAYDIDLNLYNVDGAGGVTRVNPSAVFDFMGMNTMAQTNPLASSGLSNSNIWREMMGNREFMNEQFDVLAGRMPEGYDEAVIVVDEYNRVSDYTLYALGLKDAAELEQMFKALMNGGEMPQTEEAEYSYEELLGLRFRLMLNCDYYTRLGERWVDMSADGDYVAKKLENAEEIKIVGVIRPAENALVTMLRGGMVGYTHELTEHLINRVNESEIVKAQRADPETDVLTGMAFTGGRFDVSALPEEQQAYLAGLSEEERAAAIAALSAASGDTYESVMRKIGGVDLDTPSVISIYPKDFESKDSIEEVIAGYNERMGEGYEIRYTDYIGLLLTSVTTIINAISYILIAFVSVSLVVSSIMIGVITYISVLERTKEIGILRSIGASKKDISRVFNAETLIIGLTAGVMGILITLILLIPANIVLKSLTDISGLAALPTVGAVALIAVSMLLTLVAGLIPSRLAAKKDPVEALRTE
ncbi:MAG: ABC transporter ATP-binding protein/permease [Clostridia bacterium]|nr:ABC transporter ATP-binding protein/permease [Clostridia bacterium]